MAKHVVYLKTGKTAEVEANFVSCSSESFDGKASNRITFSDKTYTGNIETETIMGVFFDAEGYVTIPDNEK